MTKQEGQEFFDFLQKFCVENAGNRLNDWLCESFLNRALRRIEGFCPPEGHDGPCHAPNDAQNKAPNRREKSK